MIHIYIKWLNTTKEKFGIDLVFWYNCHTSKPPYSFCAWLLAGHVQYHKYVLDADAPKQ